MSIIGVIYIIFGFVFVVAGQIMLLVAAFRTSIVWGLCVIFVPFAMLVFLFSYWQVARKPLAIIFLSYVVLFCGMILAGK